MHLGILLRIRAPRLLRQGRAANQPQQTRRSKPAAAPAPAAPPADPLAAENARLDARINNSAGAANAHGVRTPCRGPRSIDAGQGSWSFTGLMENSFSRGREEQMTGLLEFNARAALCRQLAVVEPDNKNLWLAEAERWSRQKPGVALEARGAEPAGTWCWEVMPKRKQRSSMRQKCNSGCGASPNRRTGIRSKSS